MTTGIAEAMSVRVPFPMEMQRAGMMMKGRSGQMMKNAVVSHTPHLMPGRYQAGLDPLRRHEGSGRCAGAFLLPGAAAWSGGSPVLLFLEGRLWGAAALHLAMDVFPELEVFEAALRLCIWDHAWCLAFKSGRVLSMLDVRFQGRVRKNRA